MILQLQNTFKSTV